MNGRPSFASIQPLPDPDSHNVRHDLACRYVGQLPILQRIYPDVVRVYDMHTEVPLTRSGYGSERIEAYADAIAHCNSGWRLLIEVKISRVQVGAIIRQIKRYGQFLGFERKLVAVDFTLCAEELAQLQAEFIDAVKLGAGFEAFVKASQAQPAQIIQI